MRILFLVNELLQVCGVSKHLYHLIDGLLKYYPDDEYFIMTGGGNSIQKFQPLGVPVIVCENLRHESRSITGYIKGIKEVYSFVKNNNVQIIHSHHHYAASVSSVVSKFANVKTILTNHGLLPEVGILNHFDAGHIIVVNQHIKNYLINNRMKKNQNISFIPYGFPKIDNANKKRVEKVRVVSGGRFVKEKGFESLIKAIANLPKETREKADFFIAGDGEEALNLTELDKKLNTKINFLGTISNFQEELLEMDIVVMTTFSKAEGFPTVLLEAGFAKNLVISSKFRGSDLVLNEGNSLLYDSEKPEELTSLLNNAINNFNNYVDLAEKYHEDVTKSFSLEKMVRSTEALYKKLLNT